MATSKKIKFWELVLMNVSAIYGIRWISRSTAESFGLGLAGIPSWVIFMFLCFVPQALMCAELAVQELRQLQKDYERAFWVGLAKCSMLSNERWTGVLRHTIGL